MSKIESATGRDYYSDLIDDGPKRREITVNGKSKDVWFRRCTAGERVKLNEGLRFKTGGNGGKAEAVFDMADQLKRKHRLVFFSNVKEDGSKVFKTEGQVAEIDGAIFDALLKHAEEVNLEDSNEGKSSGTTAS